jgi:osmotically-inducible protein OsmY
MREEDYMRRLAWPILLTFASLVLVAACSERNQEEARKTVEEIGDKSKEVAGKAAEKTKEAVSEIAEKGKEAVSATGEAITDGWITTKLKAKFADEKLLKGSNITVDTNDRVVTLKGVVTPDVRNRAVTIANGTEGVLRVRDEFVLKSE